MPDYDALIEQAYQYVRDERLGESMNAFRRAAQVRPNEAEPIIQLALLFEHFGDVAGAIELLERAVEIDDSSALAVMKLGLLYYFSGDEIAAEGHLSRAVTLIESGSAEVRRLLEESEHDVHDRILADLRELQYTADLAKDLLSEIKVGGDGAQQQEDLASSQPLIRLESSRSESAPDNHTPTPALRIGLLTALWRRPELSRFVLQYYNTIRKAHGDIDLRLYAVGSEGQASRQVAESSGFSYVEVPNKPLGAKWNAGLSAMRGDDPDAVVIVGSDDILDTRYFDRLVELLEEGCHFAGLQDMYVLDLATLRCAYWPGYGPASGRAREPIGLGRFVHREILDAVNWRLWDENAPNMLDRSMYARLAPLLGSGSQSKLFNCRRDNMLAIDIKSDANMWSMDQLLASFSNIEYYAPVKLLRRFLSISEIRSLLTLSGEAHQIAAVMAGMSVAEGLPSEHAAPASIA